MANIINGFQLSKEIREELKLKVSELKNKIGRVPNLCVILVGENPASISYVTGKEKACIQTGIENSIIKFPETITEEELLLEVNKLNNDDSVDGILVQLPLPKHICEAKVIDSIALDKDVDGFHPMNVAQLNLGNDCIEPCTPKGIMTLLDSINYDVTGKNCCVIGRSNIVGKPVATMLLKRNATVTICHSKTADLKHFTKNADVLVVAIGKPKVITKDYIKEGCVVIDVGVNRVDGKLCGDVDFDDVLNTASFITPVPKGVGPMTITSLMQNTVSIFEKKYQ